MDPTDNVIENAELLVYKAGFDSIDECYSYLTKLLTNHNS